MWIQLLCFVEESDDLLGCYEFEDHQLPDVFEEGMGLELEGQQWYILSAKPAHVRDYKHRGEVFLRLSKTPPRPKPVWREPEGRQAGEQYFDRYSLATMCANLPAMSQRAATDHTLVMHEDDWRQAEFIAPHYRREVLMEMEDIEAMSRRQMVGTKMHLRSRIATPMAPLNMMVEDVLRLYSGPQRYDGVSFRGKPTMIDGGFAFKTRGGTTFYGVEYGGQVEVMCLHSFNPDVSDHPDLNRFLEILPPESSFVPWLLIGWVVTSS